MDRLPACLAASGLRYVVDVCAHQINDFRKVTRTESKTDDGQELEAKRGGKLLSSRRTEKIAYKALYVAAPCCVWLEEDEEPKSWIVSEESELRSSVRIRNNFVRCHKTLLNQSQGSQSVSQVNMLQILVILVSSSHGAKEREKERRSLRVIFHFINPQIWQSDSCWNLSF